MKFEMNLNKTLSGKKMLIKDPEENSVTFDCYDKNYNFSELVKLTKIK